MCRQEQKSRPPPPVLVAPAARLLAMGRACTPEVQRHRPATLWRRFFAALLVFDERRRAAGRYDVLPCLLDKSAPLPQDKSAPTGTELEPKAESAAAEAAEAAEAKAPARVSAQHLMGTVWAPIVTSKPAALVVVLLTIGVSVASLVVAQKLPIGAPRGTPRAPPTGVAQSLPRPIEFATVIRVHASSSLCRDAGLAFADNFPDGEELMTTKPPPPHTHPSHPCRPRGTIACQGSS